MPFASSSESISRSEIIGVSCSSDDGGKTCYGYSETYEDGTSDACGRVPNGGPEFAVKLRYEVFGNTKCETVLKTTDPHVLPVGERICSIYLERKPEGFIYRFGDDKPTKVRWAYNSTKAEKWCQHLIDGL